MIAQPSWFSHSAVALTNGKSRADDAPSRREDVGAVQCDAPDLIAEVTDLRITAADGSTLVDDVSFAVPRGGSLGLVGESGSGKSLSSLAMLRLLPSGLEATGSVRVNDRDVFELGPRAMRAMRGSEIAMIFQDPFVSLNPVFTVRTQLHAVIRAHAATRPRPDAVEAKAAEALRDVGLADAERFLDRYPFQLSGGQAQRVAIAIALIAEPQLLIADEPTTALDVTVQDGILRLLERLRQTRNLSLLFISHDLAVVARLCDRLCIMQDGQVVESGSTAHIIRDPGTDYTRLLLDSVADFSALGTMPANAEAASGRSLR